MQSCNFPVLDDGLSSEEIDRWYTLHVPIVDQLALIDTEDSHRIAYILAAAWSLTICIYTGNEQVAFDFETSSTTPRRTCQISLDHQDRIGDISSRIQNESIQYRRGSLGSDSATGRSEELDVVSYNTALLHANPHSQWQGVPDSGFNSPASQSLSDPTIASQLFLQEHDVALCYYSNDAKWHVELVSHLKTLSEAQASNVLQAFSRALHSILESPDLRCEGISLGLQLDNGKENFQETSHQHSTDCLHGLVERQAGLSPDSIAVQTSSRKLTYRELDTLSSKVANLLMSEGVTPSGAVALLFEHSEWSVAAMLGVWKTGATIVPLDPKQPLQRLNHILEATESRVMLVSEQMSQLGSQLPVASLLLSAESLSMAKTTDPRTLPFTDSNGAAYILYTSGSTGVPKGVVMQHGAFSSALKVMQSYYGWSCDTKALHFASYAFTPFLIEILGPLMSGGCVVIPNEEDRLDNLAQFISRTAVNFSLLTPSLSRQIQPAEVPSLKTLGLCGEPLMAEDILRWSSHLRLVNHWASTEVGIIALTDRHNPEKASQNVGRCLADHVVLPYHSNNGDNENLIQDFLARNISLPCGAVGQLVVSAAWLSSGYLGDAALSSKSFIEHRKSDGSISRWYRTGDLVRQDSDGTLRLVGRADNMVKIRGQKVNTAEIEAALSTFSDFETCLVLAPASGLLKQRLVAVATLLSSKPSDSAPVLTLLDVSELAAARSIARSINNELADRLPDFMIPSYWLFFESLPLTISGKIDRARLKSHLESSETQVLEHAFDSISQDDQPQSDLERKLQLLWSKALDLPHQLIGRRQTFLELGGDSLSAMSVRTAARQLGLRVTISDLIKNGTIEVLAKQPLIEVRQNQLVAQYSVEKWEQVKAVIKAPLSKVPDFPVEMIETAHQATHIQEGMLVGRGDNANRYMVSVVFKYNSTRPFELRRLQSAWHKMIESHTLLRSVFVEDTTGTGLFTQVILKRHTPDIQIAEWRTLRSNELDELTTFLHQPSSLFDNTTPAHRLTVSSKNDFEGLLKLEIDHTLVDSHSVDILLRQLTTLYQNDVTLGKQNAYEEYAAIVSQQDLDKLQDYWKTQLEDVVPCVVPNLAESSRRQHQARKVHQIESRFDNLSELRDLCQRNDLTIPSLLKACWAIVLRAYTASDSVCFGYLNSTRDLPIDGVEDAIGPFIGTLVCALTIPHHESVQSLARAEQYQYLSHLANQHASLSLIQTCSKASGKSLFNTMLSITKDMTALPENATEFQLRNAGTHMPTEYDIAIHSHIINGSMEIELCYQSSTITKLHAESILHAFITALNETIRAPHTPAAKLNIFGYRHMEMLMEWNKDYPRAIEETLHGAVTRQAIATPHAEAIVSWDRSFTYEELDQASTSFAKYLISIGIRKGSTVLLSSEKRAFAVLAFLATLKAGAACLSIDVSHPASRLHAITKASAADALITSPLQHDHFKGMGLVSNLICLDDQLLQSMTSTQNDIVLPKTSSSDLAFILTTSGSTGVPKLIMQEHRNVMTSNHNHAVKMGWNRETRLLQFAAYTFDVSIFNIFTPLALGGVVVIPSESDRLTRLESVVNANKVNVAVLTPTVATLLKPENVPTLKQLTLGGELLKQSNIEQWSSRVQLLNAYGPAENGVGCSMRMNLKPGDNVHNVGHGTGTLPWVVDATDPQRPLPPGAIGEFLFEGPQVGRGYITDDSAQNAVFMKRPLWRTSDNTNSYQRFYLSGDLGRMNEDGSLHLLGRRDAQVKLHGQRIEIDEIEHHIKSCPVDLLDIDCTVVHSFLHGMESRGVLAAFVQLNAFNSTSDDIIASLDGHTTEQLNKLKAAVSKSLPVYMIPTLWIPVNRFPQLIVGKTDRKFLAKLVTSLDDKQISTFALADTTSKKVEPRGRLDLLLQGMWAQALKLENTSIGLHDNFFRLGGDSVAAMRLAAAARGRALLLTVPDIFSNPRLANMSNCLSWKSDQNIVEIEERYRIDRKMILDCMPCSPWQEEVMIASIQNPRAYLNHYTFDFPNSFELSRLKKVISSVYVENPILRSVIVVLSSSEEPLLVSLRDSFEFEESMTYDRNYSRNDSVDYGTALTHVWISEGRAGHFTFNWIVHQVLFDETHVQSLFAQITEKCENGFVAGSKVARSDTLIRASQRLQNFDIGAARAFWQSYVATVNHLAPHPKDSDEHLHRAIEASRSFSIPEAPNSKLQVDVHIQAAWAVSIWRLFGQPAAITFGVTSSSPELEENQGFSGSGFDKRTVPVALDLDSASTLDQLLDHIGQVSADREQHSFFGVKNIRNLSKEAAAACAFQSLLVIESPNHTSSSATQLIVEDHRIPYPFVLTARVQASADIKLTLQCSSHLMEVPDVNTMLDDFCSLLRDSYHTPSIALRGSATNVCPSTLSPAWTTSNQNLEVYEAMGDSEISLNHQLKSSSIDTTKQALLETKEEQILARVFSSVFEIPIDGFNAAHSFAQLSRDPLQAIQVSSAAWSNLLQVSVADVLRQPTFRALAGVSSFRMPKDLGEHLQPFSLLGNMDRSFILSTCSKIHDMSELSVEDALPVTPLQEGLFLLSIRNPGSYMSQAILTLNPKTDLARFKQAWQTTADRNSILRTRMIHTGQQSVQVILREALVFTEKKMDLEDFLREDKANHMKHGSPLTRYALIENLDGIMSFILTAHHSMYDGWSLKLMFEEADYIYHRGNRGLSRSPPQISAFISHLQTSDAVDAEIYWRSQFSGKELASYPPTSQPLGSNTASEIGKTFKFRRPAQSELTTSTLVRAAWAILISSYAQSKDVFFGVILTGRNASIPDIERMGGPTLTTVPICISVDQNQSATSFLRSVQDQATSMIPFEHTGLQNIKRLSPEAEIACSFQNLLVIQPDDAGSIESDLWEEKTLFTRGEMVTQTYAIIIECRLVPDSIGVTLQYQDCIPRSQIQRLLNQFEGILNELNKGNRPANDLVGHIQRASSYDLAEMTTWNAESQKGNGPLDVCIHDVVKQATEKHPDKVAVDAWDTRLSYQQLETLSTKLASVLHLQGVSVEDHVAVCFDKSGWAVVAMLAILKAGAAYLCLDPKHPMDRKEVILRDANVRFILTSRAHDGMFNATKYTAIGIDQDFISSLKADYTDRATLVKSHNTAFVVYTSGSTGIPKGIVMEHRAFCTSVAAHSKALSITQDSRVLQFASYTYDVSMGEIFSTLMQGGTVCVTDEETRLGNLAKAIRDFEVNWMFLTPTVAGMLQPDEVPTLKHLVLGGEHCTSDNIKTWASKLCLINSYGPAECAIWCARFENVQVDGNPSNIGQRVGAGLWLVDPENSDILSPIGTVGELIVEGYTLARGYLNDPEKTQKAFITNPRWALTEGSATRRMYKTGDLARFGPNGEILIVGRKDTQVKLRGQRIELGEIEHQLNRHRPQEWFSMAEIIKPEARNGDSMLVSFISTRDLQKNASSASSISGKVSLQALDPTILSEVIEKLESLLPRHMVPTAFINMDKLPMTAGGKVDRKELRSMGQKFSSDELQRFALNATARKTTPPATETEGILQAALANVLGIDSPLIGREFHFFRNGGDSITAMKLSSAARKEGLELNIRDIFLHPVLKDMAKVSHPLSASSLRRQQVYQLFSTIASPSSAIATVCQSHSISSDEIEDMLPATAYQRWTLGCGMLRSKGYMNYFTLRLQGSISVPQIREACQELLKRHQILRTSFVSIFQELYQVVLKPFAPTFHEISSSDEDAIGPTLEADNKTAKFGEIINRFLCIKRNDSEIDLAMRISHAQYDGLSLPLIMNDLKQLVRGSQPSPSKPLSHFISSNLRTTNESSAMAYWHNLLAGSMITQVVAHSRPSYRNLVDSSIKRTVPAPSKILSEGITFAVVMKAAWALTLRQFSSSTDLVFGQVVSGRNGATPDLDKVVGPCMNVVPVRVDLQQSSTFQDLIKRVQAQHLDMTPFETLGFSKMVEDLPDWPRWTRFSSVVQHTSFNIGIEDKQDLGDLQVSMTGFAPAHDVADVWIWSAPAGDDFSIDFTYSSSSMPENVAERVLEKLCEMVQLICADVERTLPECGTDEGILLPLQPGAFNLSSRRGKTDAAGCENRDIGALIDDVWAEVLGDKHRNSNSEGARDMPFFDISGDVVTAARFAEVYGRKGVLGLDAEDLLDHPSKAEQELLLQR